MPDNLTMTRIADQDATVIQGQAVLTERRRPGRLQNPSPELIALMRKPTDEAIRRVALFDAPNFVPPAPVSESISLLQLARFGTAFAVCAIAWMAMFKLMMTFWG